MTRRAGPDDASASPVAEAVDAAVRADYGRIVATLIRTTGDVDRAQDAVQEAVVRAMSAWERDGVPREPRAWLTVAARRCAIDAVRREAVRGDKQRQAVRAMETEPMIPDESTVRDDLLRLVFTCCHPTLNLDAQVALSLRTLCGLSTAEVADLLTGPVPTDDAALVTLARQLVHLEEKARRP